MPARPAEQRRSGAPARRYRRQHRRAQPTRQGRQPARRPGLLHRGFLLLGRQRRLPRRDLRLAPGRRRGPPDAQPARAPVPRPHADQGARHPPKDALAPGPALLQHRRPPERELLDPGRSRAAPLHAGIRRRLAPGPVADAAQLHGPPGQMGPRRQPGRPARHRRRARTVRHPRLGGGARRRHRLSHAQPARVRRRRRRHAPPGVLGAHAGDDITHAPRPWVTSPPFPGLAERLPAGAPMDDALFPLLWEQSAN